MLTVQMSQGTTDSASDMALDSQMARRSHRVSAWTLSQFMSQYGMAHFLHLYAPLYPHTEHRRRGGTCGGGAAAVRYVGTCGGRVAMRWV